MFFRKKETAEQRLVRIQKETVLKEIENAKQEVRIAEHHFNHCDSAFFEIANEELSIARNKLNVAVLKSKLMQAN